VDSQFAQYIPLRRLTETSKEPRRFAWVKWGGLMRARSIVFIVPLSGWTLCAALSVLEPMFQGTAMTSLVISLFWMLGEYCAVGRDAPAGLVCSKRDGYHDPGSLSFADRLPRLAVF